MDKELLRIVIIALGLTIIVGMLLWGYFRSRRVHDDFGFDDDNDFWEKIITLIKAKWPLGSDKAKPRRNKAFGAKGFEFDDAEIYDEHFDPRTQDFHATGYSPEEYEAALEEVNYRPKQASSKGAGKSSTEAPIKAALPRLIKLHIMATSPEGFNGAELENVFNLVGLDFGTTNVYERLDENRLVDFTVASMTPPGTFPEANIESFYTPGIVFFMQPQELPDAKVVFKDLFKTIDLLAGQLEGNVLDGEMQPFSEEAYKDLWKSLQIS